MERYKREREKKKARKKRDFKEKLSWFMMSKEMNGNLENARLLHALVMKSRDSVACTSYKWSMESYFFINGKVVFVCFFCFAKPDHVFVSFFLFSSFQTSSLNSYGFRLLWKHIHYNLGELRKRFEQEWLRNSWFKSRKTNSEI